MPVCAPMGFSGDFSSDGASVLSAHCCSDLDGLRPSSKRSVTGVSASVLPLRLVLSGMYYPTLSALKDERCSLVDARVGSKGAVGLLAAPHGAVVPIDLAGIVHER